MINFKVELGNDLISLIQTETQHFGALYVIASNPVIWEQHPEYDRWKKEKFKLFFKSAISNKLGCFSILDKNSNQFFGSTRFYSYDENDKAVRIGYTFISPEYWGTGINKKIKKMMLDYVFKYINKVYFDIGSNNLRSRKATEKLGAKLFSDDGEGMVVYELDKNTHSNL
jgi:RimJ/RimL family protein N-acetyltransferase